MSQFTSQTPTSLQQIDSLYETLQARFASKGTHSLAYRLFNLKQLAYLIQDNKHAIQEAAKKDLGRGEFDTDYVDLWPVINEIDLAVQKTEKWMTDEYRIGDALLAMKTMQPRIKKQPKGVALIISTWNYPWQLSLVPLVGAISAGCPAILKLSEHAPASSALLAQLLPKYLDPQGYACVLGEVKENQRLLEKEWGHVFYTGSAAVGKIVAGACAKTLTPSTLELGGKSPVIVSSCANLKMVARRMLSIKQMNGGQMCVAPDYVLCVKDRVDEFIEVLKTTLDEFFSAFPSPLSLLHSSANASLRSASDFARQMSYLEHYTSTGQLVYKGEVDENSRKMGISLVKLGLNGDEKEGEMLKQEVFGGVLGIIPVDDIDTAIRYINARPKPLALYVCSGKKSIFTKVINETTSGSATWNDFALATFARNIPFGGVGASGWGSYHGKDGFDTFTHHKSVLEIPSLFEPLMALRYPPLTPVRQFLIAQLLFAGVKFKRPISVENEAQKLVKKRIIGRMILGIAFVGAISLGLAGKYRK
ncbi:hypothetical protein L204_101208 [Cryptococcus depauperatus]|nr:aldehyde dehydrogenase (NAD+) [Cryptococcus depauperatus CBS 7855]